MLPPPPYLSITLNRRKKSAMRRDPESEEQDWNPQTQSPISHGPRRFEWRARGRSVAIPAPPAPDPVLRRAGSGFPERRAGIEKNESSFNGKGYQDGPTRSTPRTGRREAARWTSAHGSGTSPCQVVHSATDRDNRNVASRPGVVVSSSVSDGKVPAGSVSRPEPPVH